MSVDFSKVFAIVLNAANSIFDIKRIRSLFFFFLNVSSKQVIRDAILLNDFTKNFDSSQTREIVECMFPIDYKKGEIVINEGDSGAHFYVGASKSCMLIVWLLVDDI